MKTSKIIAIAAMCATSLSPIATTAAYADIIPPVIADPADSVTFDAMQTQCTALADAKALADTDPEDIWTGEFVVGAVTGPVTGPTEVGTHDISDAISGTLFPAVGASITPLAPHIIGDPYRNGGSVNMFGVQASGGQHWSASQYDYVADFDSSFRHAYSCNIYVADHVDGTVGTGEYIIDPNRDPGLSNEAVQKECDAYNKRGLRTPLPGYWGKDLGHCIYVPGETTPDTFVPPVLDSTAGPFTVDQPQTDTLTAHEDQGEAYDDTSSEIYRQVVVCISPNLSSKKLLSSLWAPQNGYSGEKCNTTWYNTGAIPAAPNNIVFDTHNWITIPYGTP